MLIKLKALITSREKEIFKKDKDLEETAGILAVEQEEKVENQRRLHMLEQAIVVRFVSNLLFISVQKETDRCIALQNEYREERDKAAEILSLLQEEMIEQNKSYEETMGRLFTIVCLIILI